jgi:chromate transporter
MKGGDLQTAALKDALKFWTKLGFISFGGPAGQIAIMHQEVVDPRQWMGEHRFLRALNFCILVSGPEAQQPATYRRWSQPTWRDLLSCSTSSPPFR